MIRHSFYLTEEEAKVLYDYFLNRAGYISREFDEKVLELIKRLREYIEEEE